MDPVYGYDAVNVEAQTRSLSSLLNWMKRLIGVRKSTKVFGRGTLDFIRPANRAVLAYVRQIDNEAILCVANISRSAQAVELDLSPWKGRVPQELLGRTHFPRIGDLPYLITLPPYGFFWFQLNVDPQTEPEKVLPREITTLVIGHGWENALSSWTRRTFEAEVLPAFMPERRWFADKDSRSISAKVSAAVPVEHKDGRVAFVVVESSGRQGASRYFLPLTVRWSRYTTIDKHPSCVLAAVRRGASEGTLIDATAEPDFISVLLTKIRAGETIGSDSQKIEFRPTSAFDTATPPEIKTINPIDREQSNSSVIVDSQYVVKVLRKVTPGMHPEFEIGRFLADVAHFRNAPALLGTVELVEGESRTALATVHAFIQNQGDAWGVTGASLDRLIDEQRLLPDEAAAETSEMTSMLQRMRQIGRRAAELHQALASRDDVEGFAPEPISAEDSARWSEGLSERAKRVFEMLESSDRLPESSGALARRLLAQREPVLAYIAGLKDARFEGGSKIRHHGDFHLGQILIAKDDAYILDFEGEPRQTLEQRRRKAPPARDVAGFLRSIDYAVSAAVERAPNVGADERPVLAQRIRSWGARLSGAFWESYWEALADTTFWPKDREQVQRLLDLFLLEKAFYEIEYELANRPTWIHIPLDGTWRILEERGVVKP
jgi:maltose alpha-D-glucosyltransferase/alpha-amylase